MEDHGMQAYRRTPACDGCKRSYLKFSNIAQAFPKSQQLTNLTNFTSPEYMNFSLFRVIPTVAAWYYPLAGSFLITECLASKAFSFTSASAWMASMHLLVSRVKVCARHEIMNQLWSRVAYIKYSSISHIYGKDTCVCERNHISNCMFVLAWFTKYGCADSILITVCMSCAEIAKNLLRQAIQVKSHVQTVP